MRAGTVDGVSGAVHDGARMVSLLIVDDNPEFCASAGALLKDGGYDVVGWVGTGDAALDAVARLQPSLVLLDVQLPDIDGFEVARRLADLDTPPAVVLISSRDAGSYGDAVTNAPVRGFVEKVELSAAALAAIA